MKVREIADKKDKRREQIKRSDLAAQEEYRKKLLKKPDLRQLFVELTDRCNLSCRHCGSSCSAENSHYIDTELLINTLHSVAEDFDPQRIMICLTGGEPLLHPDFERIINAVNELGFSWGMTSNGTLINAEWAARLRKLKMASISVSLDGLRDTHNYFRGTNADNYQRTLDAVGHLKAVGIMPQITTVVHRGNINELERLYDTVKRCEVLSWRVINVEPIGRARDDGGMLLGPTELKYMLDFIKKKRLSTKAGGLDVCYGCSHYLTTEYERELRDHCFMCASGLIVASILCNGDIYSCLDIERRPELVQGNIACDRFSEVWYNRFKEFRIDRAESSDICRECSEREFCHGDSTHTWDFDNNRPLLCIKNLTEDK